MALDIKTTGQRRVLILASHSISLINFRGPLIKDLQKAGHTVVVAAPGIDDVLKARLIAMGTQVYAAGFVRSGLNPFHEVKLVWQLIRLIKKCAPDYVLTYTAKPNIWGAIASGIARVPSSMMVTGLGLPFTNTKGIKLRTIRFITAKLYRLATSFSHRVVFQNKDDRRDFIEAGALGDEAKACLVNGSGVDTDHFDQVALPDNPVFIMVSRLLGNKGAREYGEAATRVLKERRDARFMLIGDFDGTLDSIKKHELDVWVDAGLEYFGPVADVRGYIDKASVFVLPSYREGTPRSVLEGMSMGRAIITTDVPGCRETTTDGENGFLIPAQSVDELYKRIIWMVDNKDQREKMGSKSRQIILEKFEVGKVNATLMGHLGLG